MRVRKAAVSGMFYAGTAEELRQQIQLCYTHELGPGVVPQVNKEGPRKIIALVVPHAGYAYSGPVAAHAYNELAGDGLFDTAVIISPNHTGYGPLVSVWMGSPWETPLGQAEIDNELAGKLIDGVIKADEMAHIREHSVEVQLPWLQYLYGELKIVPVTMLAQDMEIATQLGNAIYKAGGNIIVIASSDFTHYEPHLAAAEKDRSMIEAIISLDEEELYRRREILDCTMCGYGPVASAIVAARGFGAKNARLLKYASSGDVTGDFSAVVGYGSIVISR